MLKPVGIPQKNVLYEHNQWLFYKVGLVVRATRGMPHDHKYSHVVCDLQDWPDMKSLIDAGRYY